MNGPGSTGSSGDLSLSRRERLRAWLILGRIPGIGPRMADRLVGHFGDPLRVLAAGRAELEATGLRPSVIDAVLAPPEAAADADLAWAEGEGVRILTRDDPRYPPRLAQISAPPSPAVRARDPEVLKDPMLAIVGSRNPSSSGRETTVDFARYLAACGLTIVSGLAISIDGAAHTGALEHGRGSRDRAGS